MKPKYKPISGLVSQKRVNGKKIRTKGCSYCGKEYHHYCVRCGVLIHKKLDKYKDKSGVQRGLYCRKNPEICQDCYDEWVAQKEKLC